MTASTDMEAQVHARIDQLEDELIKVALDLSDIDASPDEHSPVKTGVGDIRHHEKRAADKVYFWLERNGFDVKRQGAPYRPNVLGTYKGTGRGRSVLFCSHLDVMYREHAQWVFREPDLPHMISAWRDGDALVGQGIINCKGPMSCWMISTKAIKDVGIQLPGDVLMSAVVGETGGAPVDELESPQWDSHEVGARYVASHGGIADYALIAEATAFTIVPAMTGFAYFKVTIHAGPATYTPALLLPEESMETSGNAIARMSVFIDRFLQYVNEYNRTNRYSFEGGTMVPNAQIAAIRGGVPGWPIMSPEVCSVYCDFRIPPGNAPLDIQRRLEGILAEMGTGGVVEMYKYLPGQEGRHSKGFDTFTKAVVDAHTRMFGEPPGKVPNKYVSMWRDVNPYNEIGVPAVSYGFPHGATYDGAPSPTSSPTLLRVKIADMIKAAKLYASITLDLCSRSTNDPV